MSPHLPKGLTAGVVRLIEAMANRRLRANAWRRGYRPERHYLRGPGPACRARAEQHVD